MSRVTQPSNLIVLILISGSFSVETIGVLLYSFVSLVSCLITKAGALNEKPEKEKDQPMHLHAQEYSHIYESRYRSYKSDLYSLCFVIYINEHHSRLDKISE